MKFFEVKLKDEYPGLAKTEQEPILFCYIQDRNLWFDPDKVSPAILHMPGGGYCNVSEREFEPNAIDFLAQGYQVFILRYSVNPERYPQQLLEASAAIDYIRKHAEEFHIDPDKIVASGCSAGGHLTASIGTLWNEPFIAETLNIQEGNNKPNGLILQYPVISSGEHSHSGSFDIITDDNKELREYLSLENRVGKHTPQTFLWHTANDDCVPVENSLLFATSLAKYDIPFELHIFPNGDHGLSLCDERTCSPSDPSKVNSHCSQWVGLVHNWLKSIFA